VGRQGYIRRGSDRVTSTRSADAHQETLDVESVRSALDEAERLMEHAGCDAEYYRLFCARGFVALCEVGRSHFKLGSGVGAI
jgi:hypothetical protein